MNNTQTIEDLMQLCSEDLSQLDKIIRTQLQSDVLLVQQVGEHIILAGGKRLRPLIAILAARACDYKGNGHAKAAAIIEFIHTATLLHDDVVDESVQRRGQDTANELFGNAASVLVGDFLYSRAFQMMVDLGDMKIMGILADTTNTIAEGEVLQLMNTGDIETDESRYFQVIRDKTAKLFEAAARIGAVLSGQGRQVEAAMAEYGVQLGTAFQIVDDVLDYMADEGELGKCLGDDLAEGKPTLPLLRARAQASDEDRALINRVIEQGGREHLDAILGIILKSDAMDYSMQKAEEAAEKASQALSVLPDSPYKKALADLADYAISRRY